MRSNIEELKRRKKEFGWTNQKLSEQSGIPVGTINKIFSGMTRYPRDRTMEALVHALGMDYYSYAGNLSGASLVREYGVYQPEQTEPRITAGAYAALPDAIQAELLDGKIYYRQTPTLRHQELLVWIASELTDYMRERREEKRVFAAPCDVCLDEYTVLQPDVFVAQNREMLRDGRYCKGVPEFVAEIVLAGKEEMDYEQKRHKYQSAGVKEYWVLDPVKMRVVIYAFEKDTVPVVHSFEETAESVLYPGFKVSLKE